MPLPSDRLAELRGLLGEPEAARFLVHDAINAGSAVLACLRELESLGGRPAAVASLVVRQSEAALRQRVGVPFEAIVAVPWNTWAASECPLCRAGVS